MLFNTKHILQELLQGILNDELKLWTFCQAVSASTLCLHFSIISTKCLQSTTYPVQKASGQEFYWWTGHSEIRYKFGLEITLLYNETHLP